MFRTFITALGDSHVRDELAHLGFVRLPILGSLTPYLSLLDIGAGVKRPLAGLNTIALLVCERERLLKDTVVDLELNGRRNLTSEVLQRSCKPLVNRL